MMCVFELQVTFDDDFVYYDDDYVALDFFQLAKCHWQPILVGVRLLIEPNFLIMPVSLYVYPPPLK